jgi:hypothetical protein
VWLRNNTRPFQEIHPPVDNGPQQEEMPIQQKDCFFVVHSVLRVHSARLWPSRCCLMASNDLLVGCKVACSKQFLSKHISLFLVNLGENFVTGHCINSSSQFPNEFALNWQFEAFEYFTFQLQWKTANRSSFRLWIVNLWDLKKETLFAHYNRKPI